MRTSITIDNYLINQAQKYSQAKTKKNLVQQALEEFIENHRRLNLLQIKGKIEFAEGYDYKSLRKGK